MTNFQAVALTALLDDLKQCKDGNQVACILTGVSIGIGLLPEDHPDRVFMKAEIDRIAEHFGIGSEETVTAVLLPDSKKPVDSN